MSDEKRNDIIAYTSLLQKSEEWIINRITGYSQKSEFVNQDYPKHQSWALSVKRLSALLIDAARNYKMQVPEVQPGNDYKDDTIYTFGMSEAMRHREWGVSLSMFIGLIKYFRQTYDELLSGSGSDESNISAQRIFTSKCFDRIEIAFVTEWNSNNEKYLLDELRSVNRMLTNERNKYLTIFKSFYSPVVIVDDKGFITEYNVAASSLFTNISMAERLTLSREKYGDEPEIINERLNDFIKGSLDELAFDTFLATSQGEKFFRVKFKKMDDIGKRYPGTVIVLDDLTERKEMEHQYELARSKAEEADKLKTAFLANMSHEIRTPMNAIIGFSDLLLNDKIKDEERKEYLKLILKSGNTLIKIIDDIIDISKIESKQIKIITSQFKISKLMEELFSVFDEFLRKEKKDISLLMNIDEDDADMVMVTDLQRLKQVFYNLLSNAIKFTSQGSIEFGFKPVDDLHAYFYVKDSGIGIPAEKQDHIFERFMQVEDTYTKEYGGTGLGLAITKDMVDLMDGNIWVESESGKGTTFHIILPVHFREELKNAKNEIQLSDIKNKLSLKKFKILIAEDEEINYYFLKEVLKKYGAKVIWAKNGLEAINMVESDPGISLVLMDIKMPEINGLEAIKYIKVIRPELPVIAQSAFVMDNDRDICLKAGCVDFIAKPIKVNLLLGMIARFLKTEPTVVKNPGSSYII